MIDGSFALGLYLMRHIPMARRDCIDRVPQGCRSCSIPQRIFLAIVALRCSVVAITAAVVKRRDISVMRETFLNGIVPGRLASITL